MAHLARLPFGVLMASMFVTSAQATTINLKGVVPTICELRYEFDEGDTFTSANLAIFCNSSYGARLTAQLLDGDVGGYVISGAETAILATPGTEFDIRHYNTAIHGAENFRISQVSGEHVVPTIVFQLQPEG